MLAGATRGAQKFDNSAQLAKTFKVEKREYVSPGYPVWVNEPSDKFKAFNPRVRFVFTDGQVAENSKENLYASDRANKEQLKVAADEFDRLLCLRATR
jgi:hypothetical protein